MANKSLHIDKKELDAVLKKFKEVGGLEKEFQQQLELTAKRSAAEASARFVEGLRLLKGRKEKTRGLSNSIKSKTITRGKSSSAYSVSAGGAGKEIMAYVEFGTRSKTIELQGVRELFGSSGDSYAESFKGGDSSNNFSHLPARPYFFQSVS
ncbi:MAG: hypothetical protein K0U52_10505, partial [Gammaproteobacteria bacterium]|nr:hypothetical protein [Gammaproteobacteria bacterium]